MSFRTNPFRGLHLDIVPDVLIKVEDGKAIAIDGEKKTGIYSSRDHDIVFDEALKVGYDRRGMIVIDGEIKLYDTHYLEDKSIIISGKAIRKTRIIMDGRYKSLFKHKATSWNEFGEYVIIRNMEIDYWGTEGGVATGFLGDLALLDFPYAYLILENVIIRLDRSKARRSGVGISFAANGMNGYPIVLRKVDVYSFNINVRTGGNMVYIYTLNSSLYYSYGLETSGEVNIFGGKFGTSGRDVPFVKVVGGICRVNGVFLENGNIENSPVVENTSDVEIVNSTINVWVKPSAICSDETKCRLSDVRMWVGYESKWYRFGTPLAVYSDCSSIPDTGYDGEMLVCYDGSTSTWKLKVRLSGAWREVALS